MTGPHTSLTRRGMLGGLLAAGSTLAHPAHALTSSPHPAPRPTGLWRRSLAELGTLVHRAGLGGETSLTVIDMETGQPLEGYASATALPPASVAKAATALYALRVLGPSHRFATRVMADGVISGGRLDGDLYLMGGGDPVLDTAALGGLVAQLRAAGLTEVTGALRVVDSALPAIRTIDPGQPDHLGYSPAISGLNLNFNRVYFEWRRLGSDYAVTMDARAGDLRPQVRVSSMSVQPRDVPIYTYEQRGAEDHWTVARGALGVEGGRWLPVRNPAGYAADVFQTLAGAQGLRLTLGSSSRTLPDGAQRLAEHLSPPLTEIARGMLKYSTNLTAECLGLATSRSLGARPDSLAASGAQMSAWHRAQLPISSELGFVDHSGLGEQSRISSADMALLLATHGSAPALASLLKPYLTRDAKGTPHGLQPAQVVAKTGTLNFVSGLSGYITPPSGRPLAFAIFSADLARRARLTRAERERPDGGRAWARRARKLQNDLVLRWSRLASS
ncbi:D-alanyl-D-alanine carboxypeptidase/D-alanyl-D-alanine endopeptidase [Dinoroseobacter sp. S124A]|uniref:D-alanyl-D-alanine carboxypeptidase/D-alanyl-D-alanine endopeptidase n=1 Tax=Dinoroseobacter sp. S124A TaxID=3415128 RepID=UPI003C7E4139